MRSSWSRQNNNQPIGEINSYQGTQNQRISLIPYRLNIADKTSTRLQPACIFCTEEEGEEPSSPRTYRYARCNLIIESFSPIMGIFGRVLVSGSKDGKVKIWIVPSRLEKIDNVSRVLPWAGTFSQHQRTHLSSESSPTNGWNGNSMVEEKVTASLVIEEIPLLVLGYSTRRFQLFLSHR